MIIVDALPGYRRVALVRDGCLDQLWVDDDSVPAWGRLGSVFAGRVGRVFAAHNRVQVDIGTKESGPGVVASMRFDSKRGAASALSSALSSGRLVAVEVVAAPREGKPVQVRLCRDMSVEGLISEPRLLRLGADALAQAQVQAQVQASGAEVVVDDDGVRWAEYDCDLALERACQSELRFDSGKLKGAVLHVHVPPGAAVFDIDSGASGLGAFDLSCLMVSVVMRQCRLRRLGGPIVVDFPRLSSSERRHVHGLMVSASGLDSERVALHGFTRGGLYTLARPWRGAMLSRGDVRDMGDGAFMGRCALRLMRRHSVLKTSGRLGIILHPLAKAWLEGGGRAAYESLLSGLAFEPQFHCDEGNFCPIIAG